MVNVAWVKSHNIDKNIITLITVRYGVGRAVPSSNGLSGAAINKLIKEKLIGFTVCFNVPLRRNEKRESRSLGRQFIIIIIRLT